MSYLEDFKTQINNRDFSKFLQLWEEYCTSDTVEAEEFIELLLAIKSSDFAKLFGQFVETALPLWKTIQDKGDSYHILKLLIDLQTTNAPVLADICLEAIKGKHGEPSQHNDRLRLTGLRSRENFQGALSNYDLLAHMEAGNFVFHTGGWGTGEIMAVSPIREQLEVEFEHVAGKKHITFANAFKTLIPLPKDNFLSRRFADADNLEKEAKEDPVKIIKILLRDLGPKSAAEIKDELCELVIPEKDWVKWWQNTRAKLKKDTMLDAPEGAKGLFALRKKEVTHEERLKNEMHGKTNIDEIILTTYNFVRDMPAMLKKEEIHSSLKSKLQELLKDPSISDGQKLQVLILLELNFSQKMEGKGLHEFIQKLENPEETVHSVDIVAHKKKILSLVRDHRKDWIAIFLSCLANISQSTLREYLIKELNQGEAKSQLQKMMQNLVENPQTNPELFVWYFQQIVANEDKELPYADKKGQCTLLESFLTLYHYVEFKPEYKDLTKKMYVILTGKRYAVIRQLIENTDIEFLKEFLLIASKCQTFTDHDIKILRSLAEVVQPSLSQKSPKTSEVDANIVWTTEAGYFKTQERARQVGTIEIVDNAKEIEAARALGDLRENSEYKFALERRSRLQGELKMLSEQLNRARLITKDDILSSEVSIGCVVEVKDPKGKKITYTILGPWDADVDGNILSYQSKLAQSMIGLKVGESFSFKDEDFFVTKISSYLDK